MSYPIQNSDDYQSKHPVKSIVCATWIVSQGWTQNPFWEQGNKKRVSLWFLAHRYHGRSCFSPQYHLRLNPNMQFSDAGVKRIQTVWPMNLDCALDQLLRDASCVILSWCHWIDCRMLAGTCMEISDTYVTRHQMIVAQESLWQEIRSSNNSTLNKSSSCW